MLILPQSYQFISPFSLVLFLLTAVLMVVATTTTPTQWSEDVIGLFLLISTCQGVLQLLRLCCMVFCSYRRRSNVLARSACGTENNDNTVHPSVFCKHTCIPLALTLELLSRIMVCLYHLHCTYNVSCIVVEMWYYAKPASFLVFSRASKIKG